MLDQEFHLLLQQIYTRKCEEKCLEIKSAAKGCPDRLYDTFSSFSNQDDGGIIVFGIDEKHNFDRVGVYDAQDLQKKLMEVGESMSPKVRPILSVFDLEDKVFVTAEIPPIDITERPCFKEAKGRVKGSYVRVGDADKTMTEYEVYSYEAYRKKTRNDIRPVEEVSIAILDQTKLDEFLVLRRVDHPNLAALPVQQLYELSGITRNGKLTLAAIMLFCPYPQAYFPQLSIIASSIPGVEIGTLNEAGQRFTDSKRIEGTLQEMLDSAVSFVKNNMRTAVKIDPSTGRRKDIPEYPLDAVREAILNALVHRDYSVHTENMPIQLLIFRDRLEIRSPGGLYGRLTIDQLGKIQPDTRNPFLATTMETLGQTENRYSGIPRIRQAMKDLNLPAPVFNDIRGEFSVCLYNTQSVAEEVQQAKTSDQIPDKVNDEKGLLQFCVTPKGRKEISDFLQMSSTQYAIRRYVEPLARINALLLSIPDKPRSHNQKYYTNPIFISK